MSVQRRRGEKVKIYKQKQVTDNNGNTQWVPDPLDFHETTAAFIPNRGSRAEVPGQLEIDVYDMIFEPDLPDIGIWSRVERADGTLWDIVTPPQKHTGIRRTRHWTWEVRQRASNG